MPLLAIALLPGIQLLELWDDNRTLISLALTVLASLFIHQVFFSISPDSSFGPSLIFAMLPLWALLAMVYRRRELLLNGVFSVIFLFAVISASDYMISDQRAHAPLWDPNNYVSLLYLAWIPWVFNRFESAGNHLKSYLWSFAGSFVFALALLAAHSRVAMLVVGGVGVGGMICCMWFRLPLKHAGIVLLATIVSAGFYLNVDEGGAASTFSAVQSTTEGDFRGLMLEAAMAAISDLGGLNGTGLYTFSLLYPQYRSVLEQNTGGVFVHNDFVQLFLEGGLWLTLPVFVVCICVVITGLRIAISRQWDSRAGLVLALVCALIHAGVNYVFYVLPLSVLLGLYLGLLYARDPVAVSAELSADGANVRHAASEVGTPQLKRMTLAIGRWMLVGVLLLNSLYLCLDAMTLGVFSNQLHVPGAAAIRGDAQRMQSYARIAQSLNERRGVPVLGEAMILEATVAGQGAQGLMRTDLAYQRAIEVDPWNPMGYVSHAAFLLRYADQLQQGARAKAAELLLRARQLDPVYVDALAMQLSLAREAKALPEALALSREVIQWCELIKRLGVPAEHSLFKELSAVAAVSDDAQLSANINACRLREHTSAESGREPTLMMRWLRSFSHPG